MKTTIQSLKTKAENLGLRFELDTTEISERMTDIRFGVCLDKHNWYWWVGTSYNNQDLNEVELFFRKRYSMNTGKTESGLRASRKAWAFEGKYD